jgi:hypothetical protein
VVLQIKNGPRPNIKTQIKKMKIMNF